ncbi:helix-turn-helix transcriptional regulator [Pontibacter ramchanderi]|uniref:Putative DNA-binding transcriptional regulator YafY n=1 Tax=Pontibacter ramchanderi TaxID=1179743 RepID=A0A2N3U852_9BACT|nr:YafY family protein [Pontibacter ramchanderi]PKV62895.1 putative DNA-binding transcriptional regulator YafY [Pontibacter ramchanderi]
MKKETLNRFDRIVAILIHLQSGRIVKAQEMADRFEVSLRTIYRDVRSLEAAGVPITGEAGLGYALVEGYRLPPVLFTPEEAASFVAAEKLMQQFTDKALGAHYESALYKIKSVLKSHTKERLATLEAQIWVDASQELFSEQAPDALHVVISSIAEQKQVSLQYQAPYADERTDRTIEPVGLFHENNYWYILAYCLLRNDYRQFRTDRMTRIRLTQQPFTRKHGSLADHRKTEKPLNATQVTIRVDKEVAKYLRTGRQYYGFVSEKIMGDKVEMTFRTSDLHEGLSRWYLMFADCAEIVEPESFRQRVSQMLEQAKENLQLQGSLQSSSSSQV